MPHSQKRKALFTPNTDQLAALASYAEWFGDEWKRKIVGDWIRAGSTWSGPWAFLQQVRNNAGPGWLENFDLDRAVALVDMRKRSTDKASLAVDLGIDLKAQLVESLSAANSLDHTEGVAAIVGELTDALSSLDIARCRIADAHDMLVELAEGKGN